MNITELIQKHPELKIRIDSRLLQNSQGELFVQTGNELLQVIIKDGGFETKQRQLSEVQNLRRVEDITLSENRGD